MFNLEFGGNGDTHAVTPELIKQSIEALDEKQQDFINRCLQLDPKKRPTAKELLFHPLLFEVPSLRLLATHQLIKSQTDIREATFNDSSFTRPADYIIASTNRNFLSSDDLITIRDFKEFKFSQLATFDANKYLEDVKNGIYPLTVFGLNYENKNELKLKQMSCLSTSSVQSTLSPLSSSLSGNNFSSSSASSSSHSKSTSNSSSSSTSPSQSLSKITLLPNDSHTNQLPYQQQQQLLIVEQQQKTQQHDHLDQSDNSLLINSELLLTLPQLPQLIKSNNNSSNSLNTNLSNLCSDTPSRTQSPILSSNAQNNENNGLSQDLHEKRQAQKIDINLTLDEKLKIYKV